MDQAPLSGGAAADRIAEALGTLPPEDGSEGGVRTGVEAGQAREAAALGDGGWFLSGLMRPGR